MIFTIRVCSVAGCLAAAPIDIGDRSRKDVGGPEARMQPQLPQTSVPVPGTGVRVRALPQGDSLGTGVLVC
jgi:hypothetical protein